MRDVIVIGSGHNGLVCACYAAKNGLDVLVLEASEGIGGCTTTAAAIPGAPAHLANQGAVDIVLLRTTTIVRDLELHRHGYGEIPVDPVHVYLSPDGESIVVWVSDPKRTAEEISRFSRRDAARYLELYGLLDAAVPLMAVNPTRPGLGAVLNVARHPRTFKKLGSILHRPAADVVANWFEHPMTRALMIGPSGLISPVTMPGTGFNAFFVFFQQRFGASRIVGGTQGLPNALARYLDAHRGQVRTNAGVEQILVERRQVVGVKLMNGEEIRAKAVVAACDPRQTLTQLLPDDALSPRLARRARNIPTGNFENGYMKIDVALSGRLEASKHAKARTDGAQLLNGAVMGGTFEEMVTASSLSASGEVPETIPFYAVIPTAVDSTQAPSGQDCLYIWIGWVPLNPPDGWDGLEAPVGDRIIRTAGEYFTNLEALEIGRNVEAWPKIAKRTRMPQSNACHVDFNFSRMGPLRPAWGLAGYQTPIDGLFLSGSGTHPGPAVSGIPGQLAAKALLRRFKN